MGSLKVSAESNGVWISVVERECERRWRMYVVFFSWENVSVRHLKVLRTCFEVHRAFQEAVLGSSVWVVFGNEQENGVVFLV